jgi:hypothetical protein
MATEPSNDLIQTIMTFDENSNRVYLCLLACSCWVIFCLFNAVNNLVPWLVLMAIGVAVSVYIAIWVIHKRDRAAEQIADILRSLGSPLDVKKIAARMPAVTQYHPIFEHMQNPYAIPFYAGVQGILVKIILKWKVLGSIDFTTGIFYPSNAEPQLP